MERLGRIVRLPMHGTGKMNMERHLRQIALNEIGETGQSRLRGARVLVVGAGGLGSPLISYLAGAGIGNIGICDYDTVSISNLQRQILYGENDTGRPKAVLAAGKVKATDSSLHATAHNLKIGPGNATGIISGYDIIADCCDNFETRYLLNDLCLSSGRIYVFGAVSAFSGQVSVFGYGSRPRSLRELFPDPPEEPSSPMPITGTTAGITGTVMANQILKIICGYGTVLSGKLWIYDSKKEESSIVEL